jgi:hypothetical protein
MLLLKSSKRNVQGTSAGVAKEGPTAIVSFGESLFETLGKWAIRNAV